MKAPRQYIFLILTFSTFLFPANAGEGALRGGREAVDNAKDALSMFEYFLDAEEGKEQQEEPLEAFLSTLQRMIVSLGLTKEEIEKFQANVSKTLVLEKNREEILSKIGELVDNLKSVVTPEEKNRLKQDMQKYSKQLRESIIDFLVLVLKTAGVEPSDAERILRENYQLSRFLDQLELFGMSQLKLLDRAKKPPSE